MIGARGRNRTGTPFGEDFLPTSTFAAALLNAGRSWSGARLHHSLAAVGARRLLSTPSQAIARAWLGVGSVAEASRAFAEFDGLHFGRFPEGSNYSSPLCLPISPLGRSAHRTENTYFHLLAPSWPLAVKPSCATATRMPANRCHYSPFGPVAQVEKT